MTANVGTKDEIEGQLRTFVDKCFNDEGLRFEDSTMSREVAHKVMKELMVSHGLALAWNAEEFNKIFDLFEEDEPAEDAK